MLSDILDFKINTKILTDIKPAIAPPKIEDKTCILCYVLATEHQTLGYLIYTYCNAISEFLLVGCLNV